MVVQSEREGFALASTDKVCTSQKKQFHDKAQETVRARRACKNRAEPPRPSAKDLVGCTHPTGEPAPENSRLSCTRDGQFRNSPGELPGVSMGTWADAPADVC